MFNIGAGESQICDTSHSNLLPNEKLKSYEILIKPLVYTVLIFDLCVHVSVYVCGYMCVCVRIALTDPRV